MEKSVERTQRTVIRLSLGFLLGILVLIISIWFGRDLYVRWQEKRLIQRGTIDIEQGDERDASLAARTILEMKPSSAAAARIMAQLAERIGERAALDWRRKVVQLDPQSVADQLALARSALQFNDPALAEHALASIAAENRHTAPYHGAAALLAQTKHDDAMAEHEWTEAIHLAPDDQFYRLQLAVLRLRSADSQAHDWAEKALTALRADPKQRALATRALINAGIIRHDDSRKLMELARELQAYPEATWNDRFLYLDFLHALKDPLFSSYLSDLEKSALEKPSSLAALLSWMSKNNLSLLALDYSKSLPSQLLQSWPVPLALADAYVRLRDWHNLEVVTTNSWGRFDFLRHAYVARALREQDKPSTAEHEWSDAIKDASNTESLVLLIQPVSEWKWEKETTDLLWALAKQPEKQKEAFLALYEHYAKTSDTQGLYRVLLRLAELDPTNLNVQNNLAQVALLLDANRNEACRLAADVYHKSPANPAFLTTYAYSLLTQGEAKEALRLMNSLNEAQLTQPTISAYYGICLAANRDNKARPYLDFSKEANLLPEEKALVEKAYAALDSRSRTQ